MIDQETDESLAWWDHHQMNFWLWACQKDGLDYLSSHRELRDHLRTPGAHVDAARHRQRWDYLQNRQILAKYHFVTALGSLLRALRRAEMRFPDLSPAIAAAQHLMAEAKGLRDMIEHSDEYLRGEGRRRDFVRTGPDIGVPGDKPGTADATSLIVDGRGHWLGGRLNVEQTLREIEALITVADTIPQPTPAGITP